MRTALLFAAITVITLAGCTTRDISENTVIGGSDGPTTVYLAPEVDIEKGKYSDKADEDSVNGPEDFFTGTWVTASQGYEYYGTTQAMHYVRFDGTDIIYEHVKDGEFVPDHTDKASLIEQIPGGGYIVKAETEDGGKYTYRSAESDLDVLNYYSTWDEDDFPHQYRAGASLSRSSGKIPGQKVSNEQALEAIKKYCIANNPDLEAMSGSDDFTIYWDVSTNDAGEVVVLYRSYTGAQVRYYIDPDSGETYVTELVPGITDEEQRTDESFNIKDYLD